MSTNIDTGEGSALDTLKLAAAAAVLVGGMFAYYWFGELQLWMRVLMVLASVALALGVAATSAQGQALWKFVQGSRVEIRKVVWPNRQETTQTTIAVFIFTVLLGLFFWGVDSLLLLVTRMLTGQG